MYLWSDGQVEEVGDPKLLHHLPPRALSEREVSLAIVSIEESHVLHHSNTRDLHHPHNQSGIDTLQDTSPLGSDQRLLTLSLENILTPLATSIKASFWGVVTMTAAVSGTSWQRVS